MNPNVDWPHLVGRSIFDHWKKTRSEANCWIMPKPSFMLRTAIAAFVLACMIICSCVILLHMSLVKFANLDKSRQFPFAWVWIITTSLSLYIISRTQIAAISVGEEHCTSLGLSSCCLKGRYLHGRGCQYQVGDWVVCMSCVQYTFFG
jgi:hypothetical protein